MLILATIKAVVQWMFPYDRPNCTKYLAVCCNQMLNLPLERLEVHKHLKNGGISTIFNLLKWRSSLKYAQL